LKPPYAAATSTGRAACIKVALRILLHSKTTSTDRCGRPKMLVTFTVLACAPTVALVLRVKRMGQAPVDSSWGKHSGCLGSVIARCVA